MDTISKSKFKTFFQKSRNAKIVSVGVALVVVVGGYLLVNSLASGFFASSEAEQSSIIGNAKVVDDTTASGGKALEFGAATTSPPPTTPPPSSSGFPGAHNTGVPIGLPGDTRPKVANSISDLPAYTGPMTITQDGTVIDGKRVTGRLVIQAKNVVIKNSYLSNVMGSDSENNVIQTKNDAANLLVQDSEVEGINDTSGGGTPAISRTGYTLLRANVHGSGDIIRIDGRGTVQDSWLHDPKIRTSSQHNDVIQSTNAEYIRIIHNRLENPNGQTSCILLKADIGTISDVVVDGNLMNGGGYSFYWYDSGYKISNGKVTNNRFMRSPTGGYFPKGGQHGPSAFQASTLPTWSNNVWDDTGAPIAM